MKLLTQANIRSLPELGAQEAAGKNAIAYVKLFTPDSNWTWYLTEFDGEHTAFGLTDGFEKELGYIDITEISSVRGPMGLKIERDRWWHPKTLAEIAPELFEKVTSE